MLYKLTYPGIKLPRLYVAEDTGDVAQAKAAGIPYIRWKHGKELLLKQLLRPCLEQMFPGIDWDKVLGKRRPLRSKVYQVEGRTMGPGDAADYDKAAMQYAQDIGPTGINDPEHFLNEDGELVRMVDIASDERDCVTGSPEDYVFYADPVSIQDYIGDLSSGVDIKALQELALLPSFMGDIADMIRKNLSNNLRWTEGYNKKVSQCIGRFNRARQLPNLLIIDVSNSIPDGIAATMLTLADTLRSEADAELIITSKRSGYYGQDDKLPDPQTLRSYYGRSNESAEFLGILQKYIAGREFGHVISFGDCDNPGRTDQIDLSGTKVHAVHHYHTWSDSLPTGYARWVEECSPDASVEHDTDWCNIANKRYVMGGRW